MKKYFLMAVFVMAGVCGTVCLTACSGEEDGTEVVDKSMVMTVDDLVGTWKGLYSMKADGSDAKNAMFTVEKGGKYRMFMESAFGNMSEVEHGTLSLTHVDDGWYKLNFHMMQEDSDGEVWYEYDWFITMKWTDKKHNSMDVLYGGKWIREQADRKAILMDDEYLFKKK